MLRNYQRFQKSYQSYDFRSFDCNEIFSIIVICFTIVKGGATSGNNSYDFFLEKMRNLKKAIVW